MSPFVFIYYRKRNSHARDKERARTTEPSSLYQDSLDKKYCTTYFSGARGGGSLKMKYIFLSPMSTKRETLQQRDR